MNDIHFIGEPDDKINITSLEIKKEKLNLQSTELSHPKQYNGKTYGSNPARSYKPQTVLLTSKSSDLHVSEASEKRNAHPGLENALPEIIKESSETHHISNKRDRDNSPNHQQNKKLKVSYNSPIVHIGHTVKAVSQDHFTVDVEENRSVRSYHFLEILLLFRAHDV